MKHFPHVLLLSLCAAGLPAQEPGGKPDDTMRQTAEQEFAQLQKEMREAQQAAIAAWREEAAKAKSEGRPAPALSMNGPAEQFVSKFRDAAERHAGSDGAVQFLNWLLGCPDEAEQDRALETLMRDHVTSPKLAHTAMAIGRQARRLGAERVHELLTQIIAKNEHGDVDAQALLARAELHRPGAKKPSPETADMALADLRQAVKVAQDPELRRRAGAALYEQEHLQVGMEAPDIVGEGLDGKPLRLSDYRGQVVLLDFWGDW